WPHADYTGTMIDAARQWIPPDAIKYTIEACRFWKVRYVQMHFSDDHAYTFGSKIFPQLGDRNMRISEGIIARCYTQPEMRDLEAYAVARGVTIVPELETPGHSSAMARSRPDLFAGPGCMPIASEKLYVALDKLVGEMCGIFKASPYFHIGCDECNFGGVGNSAADKEYMKAHTLPEDTHPLQDAWQVYIMHVIRMKEICHKYGKMPIAWEGMPADKRIKDGIVIMTWYSANCAREVEQQGWAAITVPWFTGPIQTWNIFYANDHIYQRTTNVLGAQRPMWQMSEYSLHESYVPGLCERQERTWGPDNDWGEEAQYRARMARSQARMSQVAAPVRPVFEGARILGISDGLKGWVAYSGAMKLSLTTPKLPGTQIHYTLDGADPTPRSPVYTGPLLMQKDFRLNAALFHDGRMLAPATRMKYEWRDVSGWITEYMISGPYMKDNLPGNKLFDIPFDGTSPWTCDLTPKGDNRCAYMRAQVWSPKAQNAQLQVASDDGAKVWLNDKVVLQNNKVQSYTDPPHRVAVALKQGWNTLLLKITQDKDGWGAMARVVAADGNKLDGLKFKAE
ncbi:MAG: family 20 glycosylhydrolase, partial [Planctomycetota bacterium]|nr:family 20 glycosylhydrolase [Planctomycetota bacterium]